MRLACPQPACRSRFTVSEEDPDSTLDDVLAHLRGPAHLLSLSDARAALARTDRAPEETA